MKRLLRKLVESEDFADTEQDEPEEPERQEIFKPAADGSVTIGNNFTSSFDSYLDKKKRQT